MTIMTSRLFSHDCEKVFSIVFPAIVDTVSFSPCDKFLLAGLRTGSVQFVYLPARR